MPKYLVQVNLTQEGVQGLLKDGGTKRRAAVEAMLKSVGGKLEAYYFALGETDVFAIADVPDNASAVAMALTGISSGNVRTKTTVLLTPEEIDKAVKKQVKYVPPGG
jgi:uncharacterized protein with GYD domain